MSQTEQAETPSEQAVQNQSEIVPVESSKKRSLVDIILSPSKNLDLNPTLKNARLPEWQKWFPNRVPKKCSMFGFFIPSVTVREWARIHFSTIVDGEITIKIAFHLMMASVALERYGQDYVLEQVHHGDMSATFLVLATQDPGHDLPYPPVGRITVDQVKQLKKIMNGTHGPDWIPVPHPPIGEYW